MTTSKKEPSKSVRITAYTIISLLIVLVIGLALEVYFRYQPEYGRAGFSYDKNLIYRLTPNLTAQKAHAWGQTGQPPFPLEFNNRGFRGEDFTKKKSEDVQRILVIGDSYTAGLDYPDELIFTAQWEKMLNDGSNDSYEVLNASCPAWGTDQHYLYWKKEGIELQPDKVVLMYSPNDMREMWNHGLVRWPEGGDAPVITKASLPFKERLGWKLATKSSFFQFFQKKVLKKDYGNFLRVFNFYPVNYGVKDSTDWDAPLFLKDPIPAVEKSYDLLEKLLVDIQSDCREMGSEFHLVKIPIRLEIDTTYQDTTIFSQTIIEERLEAITKRNNIPYHNLNADLREEETPNDIFMDWEYHYDQDGHDWIAKQLMKEIR